jgi:hypothetical protein
MRDDTADRNASGYAGTYDTVHIIWMEDPGDTPGWYIMVERPDRPIDTFFGPYETSQAAFGILKQAVDGLAMEEVT